MSNYVYRSGQPHEQNTTPVEPLCTTCKCNECRNKPIVETHMMVKPNKDPTKPPWVIHKTVITDIKPMNYYGNAFNNSGNN